MAISKRDGKAGGAVTSAAKKVVKKTERALKPVTKAIKSEVKVVARAAKKVMKKAAKMLEPVTDALTFGERAEKPTARVKKKTRPKKGAVKSGAASPKRKAAARTKAMVGSKKRSKASVNKGR